MYWYVVLDGIILPTPYKNYPEVSKAADELHEKMSPCVIDVVMK